MISKRTTAVMIVMMIVAIIAISTAELMVNTPSNYTPPVTASPNAKLITLYPGDYLDVGDAHTAVHYSGFIGGVGFKFTVSKQAVDITNFYDTVYTYDVYTSNNHVFCLSPKYYVITEGDVWHIVLQEIPVSDK